MVESNERARQTMLVRSNGLSPLNQAGILITDGHAVLIHQIAEHLIVGSILLENVDHVLDPFAYSGHDLRIAITFCRGETVVGRHLRRQLRQLPGARNGKTLQSGFGALGIVLIGWKAIRLKVAGP